MDLTRTLCSRHYYNSALEGSSDSGNPPDSKTQTYLEPCFSVQWASRAGLSRNHDGGRAVSHQHSTTSPHLASGLCYCHSVQYKCSSLFPGSAL